MTQHIIDTSDNEARYAALSAQHQALIDDDPVYTQVRKERIANDTLSMATLPSWEQAEANLERQARDNSRKIKRSRPL